MLKHYVTMTLAVLKRRPFYTAISLFGISFTLLVLMVVAAMADRRIAFTIDRLVLFESVTGGGPARYVQVMEAGLGSEPVTGPSVYHRTDP